MISLYHLLVSVVLGIVQGITEWLPVSSKTQIILVSEYLLHLNFQQAYAFGLFMEIGTVLAAVIYFRKEVLALIRALLGRGTKSEWVLFKYVVIATIVTGIVAVPLYVYVDTLAGGYNIGLPMIILGLVLFADAAVVWYSRSRYANDRKRRTLDSLSIREYVFVGIAQGLAALPGVSRSGATTSTMLVLNVEAKEAFRLSFLVGIFATAAAVFVTLIFSHAEVAVGFADIGAAGLAVAIVVATVISLLLIDFLLKVAQKSKIVYLIIALGALALASGILIFVFKLPFAAG